MLIVMDVRDNVATAVEDLCAGGKVPLPGGGEVKLVEDVPFGHKVALLDIERGDIVVKYGQSIGLATRDIRRGEHVHVHNVESRRGRGDLRKREGGDR